jgi:hypothetical protein
VLRTEACWRGDGAQAEKKTIGNIRKELELDEKHGHDSPEFYNEADEATDVMLSTGGCLTV